MFGVMLFLMSVGLLPGALRGLLALLNDHEIKS